MKRFAFVSVLLVAFGVASAAPAGEEHLRAGAGHFRAGRYEQALVEFKVAHRLGSGGDVRWYVAATLVKLGRAEESLEEFAAAASEAPQARDAVLDYYHALGCYQAKLYLCADRLLSSVGERGGPRIGAEAQKMRDQIAALFRTEPATASIDWYFAHGKDAEARGKRLLASVYLEEAAALSAKRQDRYRARELEIRLVQLRVPANTSERVQ